MWTLSGGKDRMIRIHPGKSVHIVRFSILVAVLILAIFTASTALSAENSNPGIKNMKVSLWPEYDDSRILVFYQGEIASDLDFPHDVKFIAPKGADINQVCALQQPDNEHLCQPYKTVDEGDYLTIAYALPVPTFYLEYYYDGVQGTTVKEFSYEFQSPVAVDNLEIEVQQPLRSSGFNLSPKGATITSDGQGFKYYRHTFENVAPGQIINIDASYTKSDSKPSLSGLVNQQSGNAAESSNVPLILGIVFGVTAVGGAGWYAMSRRQTATAEAMRSVGHSAIKVNPATSGANPISRGKILPEEVAFCSQCGVKIGEDDNFCVKCGSAVKR